MLVDEATITIKAGKGGDGAATFRRTGQTPKGGPDGGNGGNGGSIYFIGTDDINALSEFRFKHEVKAEDGINGAKQNLYGRNGKDSYVKVPVGTRITDTKAKWVYEIEDTTTPFLAARGGAGGRGNNEFKSATNQAPKFAEKGTPGEQKILHLELRLIADIGLIGLPNAGKSSLLEALTNAHPKIGNYPFTTLEPNLGVMNEYVLADIPGLIEGASQGKGLGIKFLKHIEKTKLLLHCIDAATDEPLQAYETVRHEFVEFNPELLHKEELILLTKIDTVDENMLQQKIKALQKTGKPIIPVSVLDENSLDNLKKKLMDVKNKDLSE
jgi:GTPase